MRFSQSSELRAKLKVESFLHPQDELQSGHTSIEDGGDLVRGLSNEEDRQ
jgi:hypothetical protein